MSEFEQRSVFNEVPSGLTQHSPKGRAGRWPFLLLILIALVLAIATGYEHLHGSEVAARHIYHAWWFVMAWGVLAVMAVRHIVRRRLWKRPVVLGIHVALGFILLGALVTHIFALDGSIHLRQDKPTNAYVTSRHNVGHLPFDLTLKYFLIETTADGKAARDYVAHTSHGIVRMNHPLRVQGYQFYQMSYDADMQGTILQVSYDPVGRAITYTGYVLLLLSLLGFCLRQFRRWVQWAAMGAALLISVGYLLWRWAEGAYNMPVLSTSWLWVHVSTIIAAYSLLLFLLVRPSRPLLRVAVSLLTIGIFLGATWADQSWGRYWGWDPKEVWALITLILYSLPLHAESLPWFRSARHLRWYLRLAFLAVLFTYFGVNFLLGGLHSYA